MATLSAVEKTESPDETATLKLLKKQKLVDHAKWNNISGEEETSHAWLLV